MPDGGGDGLGDAVEDFRFDLAVDVEHGERVSGRRIVRVAHVLDVHAGIGEHAADDADDARAVLVLEEERVAGGDPVEAVEFVDALLDE